MTLTSHDPAQNWKQILSRGFEGSDLIRSCFEADDSGGLAQVRYPELQRVQPCGCCRGAASRRAARSRLVPAPSTS